MEIRSISGHKTLQMLARYTHRLADRLAGMGRGARPGFRHNSIPLIWG